MNTPHNRPLILVVDIGRFGDILEVIFTVRKDREQAPQPPTMEVLHDIARR